METLTKRPAQLSGGQLQCVSIACALLTEPRFLVADEIVSALDVAVQAQILRLLQDMKERYGLTVLFITHDLGVIRKLSDRVIVMRGGCILECGDCADIMERSENEYISDLRNAAFPLFGRMT